MEMEARTIPLPEQPLYNVIRPVDDLWLWWVLASVIGYIVGEIPSNLLGTSFAGIIVSLITSVVSMALVIYVFNRYLSNFNWKRWVIVTIVSLVISIFVLAFLLLIVYIIGRALSDAIVGDDSLSWLISAVGGAIVGALTSGWIVARAQWRVLVPYARGYGRNLWVMANIASFFMASLSSLTVSHLTDNAYIQVTSNLIFHTLGSLIVGYTLMQILRPYAPAAAPA